MWKILTSLKFAVGVIVLLTLSLISATLIESYYDTRTAQYYVYGSWWFLLILALFGVLIFSVALSRLPWKKKHIPFLMAHSGILVILLGSAITYWFGIDGRIPLTEGIPNSTVELNEQTLFFKKGEKTQSFSFPWMPPSVAARYQGKAFPEYSVKVDRIIPDAIPKIQFIEADQASTERSGAAVQIKVLGAAEGSPTFWLWAGDEGWSNQKMGLVRFLIHDESTPVPPREEGEAIVEFFSNSSGALRYEMANLRGEKLAGKVELNSTAPVLIDAKRIMPLQVQVKKFIPRAINQTEFVPAHTPNENPTPAISLSLIGKTESPMWLGYGDQVELTNPAGEQVLVGFVPKHVELPFSLRLKEFEMKRNPGTMDPASYASYVQVGDSSSIYKIEMNEPLDLHQYAFYQSSYIPDSRRVTTTILSVNYDPGRSLKYGGSLLLVMGAILLYLARIRTKKKA